MTDARTTLTCAEIDEVAGLYVLDALEADEHAAVADHLATCQLSDHDEFARLGSVVPAIAATAPEAGAPAALKRRVLESYRAEMGTPSAATKAAAATKATAPAASSWSMPRTWLPAIATLLVLVVVGAWGVGQALEANRARDQAVALSQAIAAMSEPGSTVAVLQGTGSAAGASGFAAFPAAGGAHVVLVDLPQAPAGQTYQAWYIADGAPTSAGLMAVGSDGYAILSDDAPVPGTEVVAVTLEPAGGSAQPTSEPIIVGELAAPA